MIENKISVTTTKDPMLTHSVLDYHEIIAWDIDGTLVNGINSKAFCAYICAHPEKTHHLVTFRDRDWAQTAYDELDGLVPPEMIASIQSCPQELWYAAQTAIDQNHPLVIGYIEWKGKVSKEIGATVLVDDLEHMVERGCNRYGIAFVNALDPV